MEKLCVICKHFYFDGGSPGYSELTPGSDTHMSCEKKMWPNPERRSREILHYMDAKDYRALIRTAENCPEFDPAKD